MFDEYIEKILKECDGGAMTDGGVFGNVGDYDTGDDNRVPYVMGPMARRLKKHKKRRKSKKRK